MKGNTRPKFRFDWINPSITAVTTAIAILFLPSVSKGAETQTLQPNVFLGQWHVLGPFPKSSEASTGILEEYFPSEDKLRSGYARLFDNRVFTWQSDDKPSIRFRETFRQWGKDGENVVAYASTEFISPTQQQLLLGLAHDDEVRGWLNGVEFCRNEDRGAATTDSLLTPVTVRKGLNTLLLKVGQGTHGWEVAARFRPVGITEPLLSFRCLPNNNSDRFPTFDVTLLDHRDRVLATHRCGGYREGTAVDQQGVYTLFASLPTDGKSSTSAGNKIVPAKVRVTANPIGMKPVDETFAWTDIHHQRPIVHLQAAAPFRLRIVDNATGKPIAGARVFVEDFAMSVTQADDTGHMSVQDLSPMQWRMFAVAEGYAAKVVYAIFPFGKIHTVKLNRGGKILRGTVVAADGSPLSGAKVDVGHTGDYRPTVTTDAQGRFQVLSLDQSLQSLRPIVRCDGYVSYQNFVQPLSPNEPTEVHWSLDPAATITGSIVDAETKQPIVGAKVITGTDRFSNQNSETISDSDGKFTLQNLRPGSFVLHAISDHHAPQTQTVSVQQSSNATVDFSLATGKPVTGVVTDIDGQPMDGVRLICDTWNNYRVFARETNTDSEGKFTLAHMPDTPTEVHVLKREFVSKRDLIVTGGDQVDVQLRPILTHRITVRAAETGELVPGLTIHRGFVWQEGSRPSWQSNRYDVDRYFDKLTGVMEFPNDENSTYTTLWRFRAPGFQDAIAEIPAPSREALLIDLRMKQANTFHALVVDADTQRPLANVTVALFSHEDRLQSNYVDYMSLSTYIQDGHFTGVYAVSNEQGMVTLSVPREPDKTAIAVVAKDGASPLGLYSHLVAEHSSNNDDANPLITLAFPRPGHLKGRILRAGIPMRDTTIQLHSVVQPDRRDVSMGWRDSDSYGFGVSGSLSTNADGEFDFGGLGAGQYQLSRTFRYEFPGTQMSQSLVLNSQMVTIAPGQSLVHDIELPQGITVKGIVTDEAGQGVADCLVKLSGSAAHGTLDAATSNADGAFEFVEVPPGSYQLTSEHYAANERYTGRPQLMGTVRFTVADAPINVTIPMKAFNPQPPMKAAPGLLQRLFQSLGG